MYYMAQGLPLSKFPIVFLMRLMMVDLTLMEFIHGGCDGEDEDNDLRTPGGCRQVYGL